MIWGSWSSKAAWDGILLSGSFYNRSFNVFLITFPADIGIINMRLYNDLGRDDLEFIDHLSNPIDNSETQHATSPFAIGRANWHIIVTFHDTEASVTIYGLVENAKVNKLKIYEYLKHLLTEIPKHVDETNMEFQEDLIPWSEKLPEEYHRKSENAGLRN